MGTCHSAENAVPDETSSLEADGGSQTTKRAKLNTMPLSDYEKLVLERIRENQQALPHRIFVFLGALAHPCSVTRPRYRCAAFVVGPVCAERQHNHCRYRSCTGAGYAGSCSASACAEGAVRWAGHTTLAACAQDRAGIFIH